MYDDKDQQLGIFIGGFGFGDASSYSVWMTTREDGRVVQTPLVAIAARTLWDGLKRLFTAAAQPGQQLAARPVEEPVRTPPVQPETERRPEPAQADRAA